PSCRHTDLAAGCCDQLLCVVVLPGQPEHGQAAKVRTGTQIAARGCRKATPRDREVPRRARPGSRGGWQPPGADQTAPRLSSTAPASRRTDVSHGERQKETARGRAELATLADRE